MVGFAIIRGDDDVAAFGEVAPPAERRLGAVAEDAGVAIVKATTMEEDEGRFGEGGVGRVVDVEREIATVREVVLFDNVCI